MTKLCKLTASERQLRLTRLLPGSSRDPDQYPKSFTNRRWGGRFVEAVSSCLVYEFYCRKLAHHLFSHGGSPWDGKFFVEFAQAMERARFDYTILEDTFMVSEAWGGTAEMPRAQALQMPKHYPLPRSTLRETLHEF